MAGGPGPRRQRIWFWLVWFVVGFGALLLGAYALLIAVIVFNSRETCGEGVGDDARLVGRSPTTGATVWSEDVDNFRKGSRCEEGPDEGGMLADGDGVIVYEDATGSLHGFDPATGDSARVRRASSHDDPANDGITLTVRSGSVDVIVFDLATGRTQFQLPAPPPDPDVRAQIAGGTVVVSICGDPHGVWPDPNGSCGGDGRLVGVELGTGQPRWELDELGEHVMAALGDAVVTVEGGVVRAREATTGQLRWETELDGPEPRVRRPLVEPTEPGVLVEVSGSLIMLDDRDGSEMWAQRWPESDDEPEFLGVQRLPGRVVTLEGRSDT